MTTSIIHPNIGGITLISGRFGVGKTYFSFMLEAPDLTAMIDCDLKSQKLAEQLGVHYQGTQMGSDDLYGYNAASLSEWARQAVANIPAGRTHLIIDNATYLEQAFAMVVTANPQKFGVRASNIQSGTYGGANPGVSRIWETLAMHVLNQKGYKAITIITHVSQPWIGGKPVLNKFQPKGNKALMQLTNLAMVLVPVNGQAAPAGLILKENFGLLKFTDGKWDPKKVFPARFPIAQWDHIIKYFNKPASHSKPAPGEVPTPEELSMYSDFYTPEQLAWVKLMAELGATFEEDGHATAEGAVEVDLSNELLSAYINEPSFAVWFPTVLNGNPYRKEWLEAMQVRLPHDITCGQAAQKYTASFNKKVKEVGAAPLIQAADLDIDTITTLAGGDVTKSTMSYIEFNFLVKQFKDKELAEAGLTKRAEEELAA